MNMVFIDFFVLGDLPLIFQLFLMKVRKNLIFNKKDVFLPFVSENYYHVRMFNLPLGF